MTDSTISERERPWMPWRRKTRKQIVAEAIADLNAYFSALRDRDGG